MNKDSRIALQNELVKMDARANVYRNRAKFYIGVLNYLNHISREDGLTGDDMVTVQIMHFGTTQPSDQIFIDNDLLQDLLKIQANRFWNRYDSCMMAMDKIRKALKNER